MNRLTQSNTDENSPPKKQYYNEKNFNLMTKKFSKQNHKLSLFHINIRSLNKNASSLKLYLETLNNKFEIIVLTEIWSINIDIMKNDFPNYTMHHVTPESSIIGGVAILIKNNIHHVFLNKSNNDKIEQISIQIKINNTKTTIIGIYRHPNYNYQNAIDLLESFSKTHKNIIILGDININLLKSSDTQINKYINHLFKNNFINHIDNPTRETHNTKTLIDHIYTKGSSLHKFNNESGILINDITDHYAIFLLIYKAKIENKERPLTRIFSKNNSEKYKKEIENITIEDIMQNDNLDECCVNLITHMQNAYEKAFPLIKQSNKQFKNKPWITKSLIKCSKVKNKMYLKWKKTQSDKHKLTYLKYKKIFTKCLIESENKYFRKILDHHKKNSKDTWKILNGLTKTNEKTVNIISSLTTDTGIITDKEEIANAVNTFFTNIGQNLKNKIQPNKCYTKFLKKTTVNSIFLYNTNEDEIQSVIKKTAKQKKLWC